MYLLPKIYKNLYDVPWLGVGGVGAVISNCGTPTEKVSEFLDHHLKPVMQEGESYIKDTDDFLTKIKNPSIPYQAGLEALREANKLVKIAEFLLKNNYFHFSDKMY